MSAGRGRAREILTPVERETQPKRCALILFACEVNCTTVQLHDPERHGEPNTGPFALCREVKVIDFFPQLGRDTEPFILDREQPSHIGFTDTEFESTALGHRLNAVQDDIEDGLN